MDAVKMLQLAVAASVLVSILIPAAADDLRTCQPSDFHFEYTECDNDGGRWRVSVPNPNECTGGNPNAPVRGKGCDFTCGGGQYLDVQGDQECHSCPPGTFSLGGGVRFDDWEELPKGFSIETLSFSRDMYGISSNYKNNNCTGSGWIPKGKYLSALPTSCSSKLSYTANLVTPGTVRFTYQHVDSSSAFRFQVQNNKCQSPDGRGSTKWPAKTKEGTWKTIEIDLSSGLNIMTWHVLGMALGHGKMKQPVLIKSIELSGIAYTSECMKCKAGRYSKMAARFCEVCPSNTFSDKGAPDCAACDSITQYSNEGSRECLQRPACTADDYFVYNGACDGEGMTQEMYKWIEPKICRDDVSGASSLPLSDEKVKCPPCNPGTQLRNGTCEFCPSNHYSDGMEECTACPASTAPEMGIQYKWWNSLPVNANVSAYCLSLNTERGCANKGGWQPALQYMHSGVGHADDAYLVLSLDISGFRGKEQIENGQQTTVGEISFVFDSLCQDECSLVFMQQSRSHGSAVIKSWTGQQEKQPFTYKVVSSDPVTFHWAFQKKSDAEAETDEDLSLSFKLKDDIARIYSINVTNTLQGGASACKNCPRGTMQSGCIPCPEGNYIDTNTTACTLCPANHVVRGENPWGMDSCMECGEGLLTTDRVSCETSCQYTSPSGKQYDFTKLAGLQTMEATRLFTSGGTQYYHVFNISLCGGSGDFPMASCVDNISYPGAPQPLSNDTDSEESLIPSLYTAEDMMTTNVQSIICRSTLVPPVPGESDGIMSAQPVTLADVLVKITTDHSSLNMTTRMTDEGFDAEDMELDVHFVYASEVKTAACDQGRTTIITMRCDATVKGNGTISAPPKCSDGTCDGCSFHFLWHTREACPVCRSADFNQIKSECINGKREVHLVPLKHCIYLEGSKDRMHTEACSVRWPVWLTAVAYGVPGLVIIGVLLMVLVCYCWMKNRNLEYKYMKLVGSGSSKKGDEDGDLPTAETCALEDGEEEDQFDVVHFKDTKRGKFFSKFKLGAGKDEFLDGADNPFEDIQMSEKLPLT